METGRRDGNVTVAEYVKNDLSPPDSNIVDVKTFFSVKLLNSKDIAVLFGSCRRPTSRGRRALPDQRAGTEAWTVEENMMFKCALARVHWDAPDLWEQV
jgi:hypothetical protein